MTKIFTDSIFYDYNYILSEEEHSSLDFSQSWLSNTSLEELSSEMMINGLERSAL